MTPQAFPLAWPSFRPRTHWSDRRRGDFTYAKKRIKIPEAAERLEVEVERLGGTNLVISTNIKPTITGRPAANQGEPDDPGVAIYFTMGADPITLACDTYESVAQNLAGLAQHIEATRRIERYGVQSAKETLQAFSALPPPKSDHWRDVLGFEAGEPVSAESVKSQYRALARKAHPDAGGSTEKMERLNRARDEALREFS
ncbi:J domain-containing protein [Henriciella mobilis]|uniref:J domain-containing protein n=1 Tax=Henriciella mobilis TaxID=2305467 RepID=UPI000E66B938|nr:J domain-containing protein [Henriciella mobilis]RIJ15999.1 J domain-containing protein [Henriciella mobilis]RIJ21209.1 J domain-containing protein [Henriciella mobilis]RIJ23090.1 J domain-containing protein [Henriciella mobilis]